MYLYSHLVGIDGKCQGTMKNVKSHKTFMLQLQEPLQNLVSAKAEMRLMFCLDSALDGISPIVRVCRVPSDWDQNWNSKTNLGLLFLELCVAACLRKENNNIAWIFFFHISYNL